MTTRRGYSAVKIGIEGGKKIYISHNSDCLLYDRYMLSCCQRSCNVCTLLEEMKPDPDDQQGGGVAPFPTGRRRRKRDSKTHTDAN